MKKMLCALMMLAGTAAWGQRYGVTGFSASCLRLEPDYESALETQELMGIVVEIEGNEGYWLKVKSPQPYTAWCTDLGIAQMDREQLEAYESAPKYIVTACHSRVCDGMDKKAQQISDLVQGDILRVATATDKKGREIPLKKMKGNAKVLLPDGREGYVPATDVMELEKWADSRKLTPDNIVATAKQYLGIPYLWGGMTTKGFDCSGFVRHVYMMNGIILPRNANQQVNHGIEVSDFSRLKKGDLLFFGQKGGLLKKEKITHVGIYIGDGRFIHSSHVVRINSLREGSTDYYPNATKLIRARRLAGTEEMRSLDVRTSGYLPF